MDQVLVALDSAWRVLIACLILGAGLPVIFTVGLRELAVAGNAMTSPDRSSVPGVHRAIAYVLFAIVVIAILLGLAFIMASGLGYSITFDGVLPIIKKK